jgi:hypothetical protein
MILYSDGFIIDLIMDGTVATGTVFTTVAE